MPLAKVRGVNMNYKVLGNHGSLGGALARRPARYQRHRAARRQSGRDSATASCLHDRRNCGASDVIIDGDESEYDIWADDLQDPAGWAFDALPACSRRRRLVRLPHVDTVRAAPPDFIRSDRSSCGE